MSKPSTTSTKEIPTQLPRKSAWARGPPQSEALASASSKSSQLPAFPPENATDQPAQTRPRRPKAFGQKGITGNHGIDIPPHDNIGASKPSSVTFGSIDEDFAMIPSSPANVPPVKTEGVKSFGSVPAENGNGMLSPSFWNQEDGPSSLKQSGSTSIPPLPTIISPFAAKLVTPSLPDTGASMSKADVPAPLPIPSRKSKKLHKKANTSNPSQDPPSSLSIAPRRNFDPSPPILSASLPTAFPTPSSGFTPFSLNPQDGVPILNPISALDTAKIIEDLGQISYPEGIMRPKPELNVNSGKGKFIYDREFLLQFIAICTEKPDIPLGIICLEGNQLHHRTIHPIEPGTSSGFNTAEERFGRSQRSKPNSAPDPGPQDFTTQADSQGVPRNNRTRSKRGGERNKNNKNQVVNHEPVTPCEVPGNGWSKKSLADGERDVERKVRALLNKLTMVRFDAISNQIVAWANKSETEKDCRTLVHVTKLIFEHATNEAALSGIYARLCRKMMETISPNIRDDGIRSAGGKPIAGGQLFRKYLMSRCQEDFNRGWTVKVSEGIVVDEVAETSGEAALYSYEYRAAQKAKRQRLGLVQFYGELYKLQMLTERIMHECTKTLIKNVNVPGEEEIEGLCRLLMTIGKLLDHPKARAHMDVYFTRMKALRKNSNVTPRVQFMVQDLIELRGRGWVPRNQVAVQTALPARPKPPGGESEANGGSGDRSRDNGGDGTPRAMPEDEVHKQIAEDVEELFSARDIDKSEDYFDKLPSEHHRRLVDKMVSKAIESKEADGKLVAGVFARAVEKNLCSISSFEEGFLPVAEFLDDAVIDAPKAFQIMATVMGGAGLDKDEGRRARIVQKSTDSDKLLELLS